MHENFLTEKNPESEHAADDASVLEFPTAFRSFRSAPQAPGDVPAAAASSARPRSS